MEDRLKEIEKVNYEFWKNCIGHGNSMLDVEIVKRNFEWLRNKVILNKKINEIVVYANGVAEIYYDDGSEGIITNVLFADAILSVEDK